MTSPNHPGYGPFVPSRRAFLRTAGLGAGSLALASMFQSEGLLAAEQSPAADPLAPKKPHFAPKTKAGIWAFVPGSRAQGDTFAYKPALQERDGQPLGGADPQTGLFTTSGKGLKSPFKWRQYGQSGTWVSDVFERAGAYADDMAFMHSC